MIHESHEIHKTHKKWRAVQGACLTLIKSKATNAGIPFGHKYALKSSPEHYLRG